MNSFFYENQGTNTFLVYKVGEGENTDSFCLGMIANNQIPGLAPTVYLQIDNTKHIKYNVTAKVSVSQFFAGAVNKKRLIGVFDGIVDAMLSAEEYMIEQEMIMLDLDYIFTDVSTCKTDLICLPVSEAKREETDFRTFFKNIMFSTQFDQTENCDYVAKIMNYLNSTPSFSLNDFKNVLEEVQYGAAGANASGMNTAAAGNNAFVAPVAVNTGVTANATAAPQPVAQQPNVTPPIVQQPKVAPAVQPAQPVINSPVQGMNIPGKQTPVVNNPVDSNEKEMSKMYLLQHYSKENKAIYDAQQAAKKNKAAVAPAQPAAMPARPVTMPAPPVATPAVAAADSNEKPMTMMYLLQHYSKENKAIYDAQQAAKKGNAPATNNAGQKNTVPGANFSIPGQAAKPVTATPAMNVPPVAARNVAPQPVAPQPVAPQPVAPQPVAPQPVAPQPVTPPPVVPQPITPPPVAPVGAGGMNFGETTILGGGSIGETTVLGVDMNTAPPVPHLIRSKNNEKININKPNFRIGKERSYVDYFIGDNTAISRSHANIITNNNGEYFVVDTNSTNHTYVDGVMIQSNIEVKLSHGAKIRFANEDFEFRLY